MSPAESSDQRIELVMGLGELAVDQPDAGDQGEDVGRGGLGCSGSICIAKRLPDFRWLATARRDNPRPFQPDPGDRRAGDDDCRRLHQRAGRAPPAANDGLQAIEIPYANGPISAHHVPQIWPKFRGHASLRFGMDTGSTGIVMVAEHFAPGPGDVSAGPGQLVYNSSGRVLHGMRYTTEVEILRREQEPAATARAQVLRVERISCLEHARECRPEERPRGVAFMGIGFDREAAQRTVGESAPKNPFTSLVVVQSGAPANSVRPSYIVGRSSVHLGMTRELTHGFAFAKLTQKSATGPSSLPEWNGAPLTVTVDGHTGSGTSLVDSGIDYMFISLPAGSPLQRGTPAGTRIALFFGSRAPYPASYAFTVAERGDPLQPEKVEALRDPGVFANTGRMFLEGFDYLYDTAGGYVGDRWTGRVRGEYGRRRQACGKGDGVSIAADSQKPDIL